MSTNISNNNNQNTENKFNFTTVNNYIIQNKLDIAEEYLEQWLIIEPQNPLIYTLFAHIQRKSNNLEQALNGCNKALKINNIFYSAMVEKARILVQQNNYTLACHIYLNIYQQYPKETEYLLEWCKALTYIQDYITLEQVSNLAINSFSYNYPANSNAEIFFYAGLALQCTNKPQQAITCYEQAFELNSNMYMLCNNLGAAYKELNNLDKAITLFSTELNNYPQNYQAWTNYASALHKQDKLDEAYQASMQAINLAPQYPISYNNLALVLKEMQNIKGAEQALETAIKLDKNYSSAKWNLAMVKLIQGKYKEGWVLHEYRWQGSSELRDKPHGIKQPEFDTTQNLNGKKLFVWGEQGFGDALQFCRYLPLINDYVKKQGGEIIYCCFESLENLFKASFADLFPHEIINDKHRPLPYFDYHLPLLKLPLIFNTTLETIPQQIPYIKPSNPAIEKYKNAFTQDKHNNNLKIGLIWTGSYTHQRNPYRSIGIENYIRFKDIENVSFYGLQFNADDDIKQAKHQGLNIIDATKNINNFDESAALMQHLDLVITTCTSTAHLAGSLGIPTWLLLDINPHWVWLLNRTDSPWYPKTKIYRQTEYKNWQPIMHKFHQDLKAWAQANLALKKPKK